MRTFVALMGITIQQKLHYRMGFLLNLVTPMITLLGQMLLWAAIYNQGGSLPMDRAHMQSYVLLAFMINSLLTWGSENELSREIRSGTIIVRRMRPFPFLGQSLAGMCGNALLQGTVNVTLVVIAFFVFRNHLAMPSFAQFPLFLLCLLMGLLLRMMMVSFFSLLCFFTTGHLGLTWTRTALMEFFSGALIPVALFPVWLMLLSYCTPFPLMVQVPIAVLLNQPLPLPMPQIIGLQIAWALIFYGLHELLYSRIRKTATLAGG